LYFSKLSPKVDYHPVGEKSPHLVTLSQIPIFLSQLSYLISNRNSQCFRIRFATSVARWFIFKPKIQIWVNFGRSCNGRCFVFLGPFWLFYGQMVHFMVIWYILLSFGIFLPVLVYCTEKNLATLSVTRANWLLCDTMY
jgi:hypothetical protein